MKKLLLTSLFVATLSALSTGCGDIEVPLSTTLCEDACEAQARAACGGTSRATCERACRAVYQGAPSCEAQIDRALRCAVATGYVCSGSLARVNGCVPEGAAMMTCLDAAARGTASR